MFIGVMVKTVIIISSSQDSSRTTMSLLLFLAASANCDSKRAMWVCSWWRARAPRLREAGGADLGVATEEVDGWLG